MVNPIDLLGVAYAAIQALDDERRALAAELAKTKSEMDQKLKNAEERMLAMIEDQLSEFINKKDDHAHTEKPSPVTKVVHTEMTNKKNYKTVDK